MDSELRQFIISKCRSMGISIEHLAQVSDCTLTEIKGFAKGLFILDAEKIVRLLESLSVTQEELEKALGDDIAAYFSEIRSKLA
jgi:hypothetical protein